MPFVWIMIYGQKSITTFEGEGAYHQIVASKWVVDLINKLNMNDQTLNLVELISIHYNSFKSSLNGG